METVNFVHMEDGTREDYQLLARLEEEHQRGTADRVLRHLRGLDNSLNGYQVDRLEHSLQCATRAYRDGAEEEMVVAALLHDIGDMLAPHNHSEMAAAVLRPYVSEKTYWVVRHHGIFQAYYYAHHLDANREARQRYQGHPYFQAAVDFCQQWDQSSFDPAYDTLPLETFEPMARRVFSREPFSQQPRQGEGTY